MDDALDTVAHVARHHLKSSPPLSFKDTCTDSFEAFKRWCSTTAARTPGQLAASLIQSSQGWLMKLCQCITTSKLLYLMCGGTS